jgi:tripartite-type tricarboxylate transporter receptor subunit TctC
MNRWLRRTALALLACLSILPVRAEEAAEFPSRPIRIIVAFPAGGGVDATARVVGDQIQRALGQPVTVENRTGAGGNIAAEAVVTSPPDGYTLLASAPATFTINHLLFRNLPYDPAAFAPVAIMSLSANVLAVRVNHPAQTVADLITYVKENPGKTSFASQGNGTTSHLTAALFERRTGLKLVHVPYRGTAPALNDLSGGHVDMMFVDLGSVLPLHEGGRVRIIAVASEKRLTNFPQIPTVAETIPDFVSNTWFALAAPPGTPPAIVAKLNKAVVHGLASPEAKAKYRAMHTEAVTADPAEIAKFIAAETHLWSDVIRAAGITLE